MRLFNPGCAAHRLEVFAVVAELVDFATVNLLAVPVEASVFVQRKRDGLADAEASTCVRVCGAVFSERARGNEAADDRKFDDKTFVAIGVGRALVAGDGEGVIGADVGEVIEDDDVGAILEVCCRDTLDAHVAEYRRLVRADLEREAQPVRERLVGRRVWRGHHIRSAGGDPGDFGGRGSDENAGGYSEKHNHTQPDMPHHYAHLSLLSLLSSLSSNRG